MARRLESAPASSVGAVGAAAGGGGGGGRRRRGGGGFLRLAFLLLFFLGDFGVAGAVLVDDHDFSESGALERALEAFGQAAERLFEAEDGNFRVGLLLVGEARALVHVGGHGGAEGYQLGVREILLEVGGERLGVAELGDAQIGKLGILVVRGGDADRIVGGGGAQQLLQVRFRHAGIDFASHGILSPRGGARRLAAARGAGQLSGARLERPGPARRGTLARAGGNMLQFGD